MTTTTAIGQQQQQEEWKRRRRSVVMVIDQHNHDDDDQHDDGPSPCSPLLMVIPAPSSLSPPVPSTCLLRTHSLSPSHHSRHRPKSRPRSTTETAINWWPRGGGGGGGGNGLMAMIQRALCSGGGSHHHQNGHQKGGGVHQYRTVLTRESPDSGLELDRMENGMAGRKGAEGKGGGKVEEDGQNGVEEAEEEEEAEETDKKQRPSSFGRLLSSFLSRPSLSHSMFDFPSPSPLGPLIDPNGYAVQSPISQLSRANAVLMAENQQMGNRIEELEHSLHDHVAHLNSVYFTLHQRHGFDALQLPDGELVQLSQFKGPEVVLLTFVRSPPGSIEDVQAQQQMQLAANRRHRLQQQIRQKQAAPSSQSSLNGGIQQQENSQSPSISGGSSCSFVSASSDSSIDPVEMFHQLCIRPKTELAEDDREQIQAYVDWLKSEGANGGEEEQEGQRILAKLRAQQIQSQVQLANGDGSGQSSASSTTIGRVHFSRERGEEGKKMGMMMMMKEQMNGWRKARSETGGGGDGPAVVEGQQNGQQQLCAQLSEPNGGASRSTSPRFGGGASTSEPSKSQRIRTQFPSGAYLQTRRMTHAMGGSYCTSALMSGNHHAGAGGNFGGGGREERSPRRGGIGLVSACRNTMRANAEHSRATSRNLI